MLRFWTLKGVGKNSLTVSLNFKPAELPCLSLSAAVNGGRHLRIGQFRGALCTVRKEIKYNLSLVLKEQ